MASSVTSIPKVVEDQYQAAVAQAKDAGFVLPTPEPEASAEPAPEPKPAPEPAPKPPVSEPASDDGAPALSLPGGSKPDSVRQSAQPDGDAKVAQLQQEFEALKHRYDVLQGKTYKEVPRLSEELRETKERERAQLQRIAELERAIEDAQPLSKRLGLSEDELEEYDENTLRVLAKASAEAAKQQTAPLLQEIAQLKELLSTTNTLTFESQLGRYCPDYQDYIDGQHRADFRVWLGEQETADGRTRYDNAMSAIERGDAKSVAAYVNTFKQNGNGTSHPNVAKATPTIPRGKPGLPTPPKDQPPTAEELNDLLVRANRGEKGLDEEIARKMDAFKKAMQPSSP